MLDDSIKIKKQPVIQNKFYIIICRILVRFTNQIELGDYTSNIVALGKE